MESRLKYKHFIPNKSEHQMCSELMSLINDLSPSDSNVQATVDRKSDGSFKAHISVRGFCGDFESESSGISLLSSLRKAQKDVLNNIIDWKRHRFV